MPAYDYECECGVIEEIHHSMTDVSPRVCKCGKNMKRLIPKIGGILYKARGFYHVENRIEKQRKVENGIG